MRYFKKYTGGLLFILVISASCVPAKHFQEMRREKEKSEQERDSLLIENKRMDVRITEMEAQNDILEREISELVEDSTERAIVLRNTQAELEKVQRQLNDLQQAQETLAEGSARETSMLLQQIQVTQGELMEREDRLKQMEEDLLAKETILDKMAQDLEERNIRLVELEQILFEKDSVVNALLQTIQTALRGFEDEGLTVHERNGKVYVSLEEKLLFQTGSIIVDAEGERAIRDLAKVLEKNPDINIMIEGHTDNVPVIPGPRLQDNWDLSALRATSIVRILLDGSDIDPTRVIVAGRGEHIPLDPSDTAAARQINRRTEIILTPQLDELLQILESN